MISFDLSESNRSEEPKNCAVPFSQLLTTTLFKTRKNFKIMWDIIDVFYVVE